MSVDAAIKAVLNTLEDNWEKDSGEYRIRDWDGEVLAEKNAQGVEWKIDTAKPLEDKFYHAIYKTENKYYLQGISCLSLKDNILIIENMEEVSNLFTMREVQRTLFFKITIAIGLSAAFCNFFLSKWLTRSIKELEMVTTQVANGELKARVEKIPDDEIGSLSRKFNNMAESLDKSFNELKELSKRQEDFVGNFSHELKTPLTSIIGYADLLRTHKVDETTMFEAINYIFLEGKRLENLSLKMLELLVERKREPQLKIIQIELLVTEVLDILKPKLEEKKIHIKTEITAVKALADADLMKTVIINVVENAIKAVEQTGTITISLKRKQERVLLCISDNGCGVPPEEVERLTEAFYMVDKSRSRSSGGVGLGLSICKQVMELHNGRIEFESELDKGTKVSLIWNGSEVERK